MMIYELPTLEKAIEAFEKEAKEEEERARNMSMHPKVYFLHKCNAARNRQIARWLKQLLDFRRMASDGENEDALLRTVKED